LITAAVFIGIPIVAGFFTRKTVIKRKGETWFNDVFKNALGKVAIVSLLMTLVILFALNGNTLIANPALLWKVSVPLLLSFAIVVTINLLITKIAKFKYREAIVVTLIGSSSHFEIAIATAIGLYGISVRSDSGFQTRISSRKRRTRMTTRNTVMACGVIITFFEKKIFISRDS
jgi:ACR3 family arsenite transporter